jgi:hypothetical protein
MPERPLNTRQYAAHSGAELCLVILLLITAGVAAWQHQLFGRNLVLDRHSATRYVLTGYADHNEGGASIITFAPRPLAWTCDMRPQTRSRYCGYEVLFDGGVAKGGLDLSKLDSVQLTIDYHGPSTTLRIFLKDNDPLYSAPHDYRTYKINTAEFSVVEGRQTVVIPRDEFSVADWWLAGRKISPGLARTQFDRVVALDLESSTTAPAMRYSVVV